MVYQIPGYNTKKGFSSSDATLNYIPKKEEKKPFLNLSQPISQSGVTNIKEIKKPPVIQKPVEKPTEDLNNQFNWGIQTANANENQNTPEKYLTKDKVKEIIDKRPEGVQPIDLFKSLEQKGYIMEGYNDKEQPTTTENKPVENASIQDMHPTEGVLEQTAKALPRAIKDTGMGILEGVKKGVIGLGNIEGRVKNITQPYITSGLNAITGLNTKPSTIKHIGEDKGLLGDISQTTAGTSSALFNTIKAPMSVGLNTASQLPGTQYVMQGLGKVIEGGSNISADITGIDRGTMQDITTTGMNTLGLKMKSGDTLQTIKNTQGKGIIGGAKSVLGDTLQSTKDIAKMPLNVTKGVVKGGASIIGKGLNKVGVKSPLSQEYVPAKTEGGQAFEVDKTPGLKSNITDTLFKKSNEILAQQSIMPKLNKSKTSKDKIEASTTALNGIKQLYEDKAKGNVKSDISTMGGGVEGLSEGLDYHGKIIGNLTKNDAKVNTTDLINNLEKSVENPKFGRTNASILNIVKDTVGDFKDLGKDTSIKNIQEGLSGVKNRIFKNQENISDLYKTDAGRELNIFLKGLEDNFNKTIEQTSGNSKQLLEAKSNYAKYKKIEKDFIDSYMVELRNQGKGVTGTAGKIAGLYEVLSNPSVSGILKAVALKQAGETMQYYKSRGGNYETLIRNLDREAVNRNLKPNIIKNDTSNSNSSSSMDNKQSIKQPQTFLQKTKDKMGDIVDEISSKVGGKSNFLPTNKYQNIANKEGSIIKHKQPYKMTPDDVKKLSEYVDTKMKENQVGDIRKVVESTNKEITNRFLDTQKRMKLKTIGEHISDVAKKYILPSTFKDDLYNLSEKIAKFTGTKSNIIENTKSPILKPKIIESLGKSRELELLINQAKKYKTFDEFKKSQGEELYHGTTQSFKEFKPSTSKGGFNEDQIPGIYVTNNKNIAKIFTERVNQQAGHIINTYNYMKNPLVIKSNTELGNMLGLDLNNPKNLVLAKNILESKGYDGIIKKNNISFKGDKGDEIIIFNPKSIKTETQLKQIYEQSKKTNLN